MSDSASLSAFLAGRAAIGNKLTLQGGLLAFGSLATALGIFVTGHLVSAQKEREAGRMIVEAQRGDGYIATIVHGFAAAQGRPRGF